MFGKSGSTLGASCGAAGLITVCRGCVGCTGSVTMRWRGWKASAPFGGKGLSGSACEATLGFAARISTSGKSLMGPDQVSCVLSNAGLRRSVAVSSEHRSLGNAALNPAISEVLAAEKVLCKERPREKGANAARKPLVKISPGNFQLGLDLDNDGCRRNFKSHPRSGSRALSREVEPTIDLAERHESPNYSVTGAPGRMDSFQAEEGA